MAYLGYKNKAFREYKREQERIRMLAFQKEKKKQRRLYKNLFRATVACIGVAVMLIALYALVFVSSSKAEGSKVGVGGFVMAVSYTDSYDDLVYVSNFVNCDHAMKYYNDNCTDAKIMMCQQEAYLYMPIGHNSDSSFDFEPTDKQSCGFVGVQKPKFTEGN
jgi:hypothetical protein